MTDTAEPSRLGPDRWSTRRWSSVANWLLFAAVAVPFAVMLVVALTRQWYPVSDTALIELRTLDVGTARTPLVGPYSRLGWNHPGPLLFYLLAAPLRSLLATDRGLLMSALLINAAVVVGILVLARRRGGLVLTGLAAVTVALLIRGEGAAFLTHVWNPDLPVLAVMLLIVVTWSVIEGDLQLFPLALGLGAFASQSHVGYLPVTGFLVLVAAVSAVRQARRRHREGDLTSRQVVILALASVLVVAVTAAPIVVDQFLRPPGNLHAIVTDFRHPAGPVLGLVDAARIAAMHLTPTGAWVSGDEPTDVFSGATLGADPWGLLAPVAGVAVALVATRARRARPARRLVLLVAATAVVGLLAASRTTGDALPYLYNWFRPVAASFWLAVAWTGYQALASDRRRRLAPWLVPAAVVVALVVAAASLVSQQGTRLLDEPQSAAVADVLPATLAATTGEPRVMLEADGPCGFEISNGLALQLVRHGTEVVVPPAEATSYGPERVGGQAPRTVVAVCGPGARPEIDRSPVAPVATSHVLTTSEQAELDTLREDLRRQLRDRGRSDLAGVPDSAYLVGVVAATGVPGVDLDLAPVRRLSALLSAQRFSVAVFVRPTAPA